MATTPSASSADRRLAEQLMSEKLETLRLLRALDAVGVVPQDHDSLPIALARLLAFDQLLDMSLVLTEAADGAADDPEFVASLETFLEAGPVAREEVRETLPPALNLRVAGAFTQTVATEAEVRLELDALRAEELLSDDDDDQGDGPDLTQMFEAIEHMAESFGSAAAAPAPKDERVARQEAKPLPRNRDPEPWLERLPVAWLKTISRLHGLDPARKKAVLVRDIARHLGTPDALRPVLAQSLDLDALVCLGELVTFGDVAGDDLDEGFAAAADVPWDWTSRVPAVQAPGRLRVFGLAFVGGRRGESTYAMPPGLHQPVAQALLPLLRDAGPTMPEDVIEALEIVAGGRTHVLEVVFGDPHEGSALLDRPGQEQILELEVTLRVDRPVSRRLLVSNHRSLGSLHEVLQVALGWEDYHLHQFNSPATGRAYGSPDPELDPFSTRENEWEAAVGDVFPRVRSRLEYEYDFGDCWEHDIRCVGRHVPGTVPTEPHCLSGSGACPPEDVGGRWGYARYLEALADPDHPEHEDMVEWRGPDFDPDQFQRAAVNARLAAMAVRR